MLSVLFVSALGNVITVTYAASRVNQGKCIFCRSPFSSARLIALNIELAKEGIPLPFGNKFWASNWPTGKSPLPGLIVHLIPSVIVIIAPPPAVAYPFILDVEGYPAQIINLFIVVVRWPILSAQSTTTLTVFLCAGPVLAAV